MASSNQLDRLRTAVESSQRIAFFGGAGVSTESGIPDFRSADGLFSEKFGLVAPEEILSHHFFEDAPSEFFAFYRSHLLHPGAQPNAAHRALAKLEAQGRLLGVVTQNIDGLHQAAGSHRVAELHGTVRHNHCTGCGADFDWQFIGDALDVPLCTRCGAIVKPDVVLYEEALDDEVLIEAAHWIAAADTLIVAGTSLSVYPAASLIQWFQGDSLIIINRDQTPFDPFAGLVIHGDIGQTLGALPLAD